MSLIELTDSDQPDNTQIAAINFMPNGKFAPGNSVHELSSRGKGYAKFSTRMAILANERTAEEIMAIVENVATFKNLTTAEIVAYKACANALEGGGAAEALMNRIDGNATQKIETKLTGGLAVMTADVTNLILEIADDMGD